MVKKNLLRLFFLISILISFNSCEVKDFEEDDLDLEELLCNYKWKESLFSDEDGYYYHQIVFSSDGTGNESFIFEDPYIKDKSYDFDWYWCEDEAHAIDIIYYLDDKEGFFTNIWIDDDWILTGKLNGSKVTFE